MRSDAPTLRDIYDAVGRLEEKVGKRLDKHEEHIDRLESFQNRVLGTMGVLSMMFTIAFTYFWNKVTGREP